MDVSEFERLLLDNDTAPRWRPDISPPFTPRAVLRACRAFQKAFLVREVLEEDIDFINAETLSDKDIAYRNASLAINWNGRLIFGALWHWNLRLDKIIGVFYLKPYGPPKDDPDEWAEWVRSIERGPIGSALYMWFYGVFNRDGHIIDAWRTHAKATWLNAVTKDILGIVNFAADAHRSRHQAYRGRGYDERAAAKHVASSPPPPPPPPSPGSRPLAELTAAEADIVDALRERGRRMTTEPLLHAAFGKENSHGKAMLAALVKRGVLVNRSDTVPRGYGLPEWPDHMPDPGQDPGPGPGQDWLPTRRSE